MWAALMLRQAGGLYPQEMIWSLGHRGWSGIGVVRKCESMVVGLELSPLGSLESQVHAWSLGLQGLIRA